MAFVDYAFAVIRYPYLSNIKRNSARDPKRTVRPHAGPESSGSPPIFLPPFLDD